ncbi:unnamed protein product [Gongylonema pulchrum]|uniref:Transposase n=1 Tax=Gongylonema pulchrum TaxID=637853 RepID=A0A183D7D4_9BILA|nr:unnamed protein product [Gongylonema pulchrum]
MQARMDKSRSEYIIGINQHKAPCDAVDRCGEDQGKSTHKYIEFSLV